MKTIRLTILVGIACALTQRSIHAQDVNYFRHRGGVYETTASLPHNLGDEKNVVWKQPLNPGHSTPCIHGDRIFLTTFDEKTKELATIALRLDTGRQLWKRVAPATRVENFHRAGSPAAPSVACDGKRVFSFFGSYGLVCYDLDGKELWKKPMGPFPESTARLPQKIQACSFPPG